MNKYACQSNINLTKLHNGICYPHEQKQLREGKYLYKEEIYLKKFILACKTLICLNGKSCMFENGIEVCRCLFNCSSEKHQVKKKTISSSFLFVSKNIFLFLLLADMCIEWYPI